MITTLYLDCEWDGYNGELISMALVPEDAPQHDYWYEVATNTATVPWVKENVIPVLEKHPIGHDALKQSLYNFLKNYESIHVVADWPEDISHFCKALIVGEGVRNYTPPLTMEIVRIDSISNIPHNALADAIGIKNANVARKERKGL